MSHSSAAATMLLAAIPACTTPLDCDTAGLTERGGQCVPLADPSVDGGQDDGSATTGDSGGNQTGSPADSGPDAQLDAGDDGCTPRTWYRDLDDDDRGDPAMPTAMPLCEPPDDTWVDNADDQQPNCTLGTGDGCAIDDVQCIERDNTHIKQTCIPSPNNPGCTSWTDTPCPSRAPLCNLDTAVCGGCKSSADCAEYDDTPVCDTSPGGGQCVVCGPGETQACAGKACNTPTHECSQYEPESREPCQACDADEACGQDLFCVPMRFQGEDRGAYCLAESAPCERPYATVLTDRASLSDPTTRDFCGLNEQLATCEAVHALLNDVTCEADGDCPDGGLCRQVGALEGRCSYECSLNRECPEDSALSTCSNTFNDDMGPTYCGGENPPAENTGS